jgi:carbonic anhydrase
MRKRPAHHAAWIVAATIGTFGNAGAMSPDDLLRDGNRRFAESRAEHPDQTAARRAEVAAGQRPFAVVVGCSDSRVPPEILFDRGLGDLFVVRSAGQVVGDTELGSVEFAVANLGAPLVVVLGHERCGAVEAAFGGSPVQGRIQAIVDAIRPNLSSAGSEAPASVDDAVRAQVRGVVAQLRSSEPVLAPRVRDGTLQIVGAVYDLDDGRVAVVEPAGGKP